MADLSISQVREKFPQYSDMSDEQLAQGLHKKYYSDMPFDAFSQKIGLKREQMPMYDPMGGVTGYTEAKAPVSQQVRQFERREGPFGYAKEFGKGGIASAVGAIPEMTVNLPSSLQALGTMGARKVGLPDLGIPEIPRVGYGVPEASKYLFGEPKGEIATGMRTAGEVLGIPGLPTGVSAIGKVASTVARPFKYGAELVTTARGKQAREAAEALRGETRTLAEEKRLAQESTVAAEQERIAGLETAEREVMQSSQEQLRRIGAAQEQIANREAIAAERAQRRAGTSLDEKGRVISGQTMEQLRAAALARTRDRVQSELTKAKEAGLSEAEAASHLADTEGRVARADQAVQAIEQRIMSGERMAPEQFGSMLQNAARTLLETGLAVREKLSGFGPAIRSAGEALIVPTKSMSTRIEQIIKSARDPAIVKPLEEIKGLLSNGEGKKKVLSLSIEQADSLRKMLDRVTRTKQIQYANGTAGDAAAAIHHVSELKDLLVSAAGNAHKPYKAALEKFRELSRPLDIVQRKGALRKVVDVDNLSQDLLRGSAEIAGAVIRRAKEGHPVFNRLLEIDPNIKNGARAYFNRELFGRDRVPTTDRLRGFLQENEGVLRQLGLSEEFGTIANARAAGERALDAVRAELTQAKAGLKQATAAERAQQKAVTEAERVRSAAVKRQAEAEKSAVTSEEIKTQTQLRAKEAEARLAKQAGGVEKETREAIAPIRTRMGEAAVSAEKAGAKAEAIAKDLSDLSRADPKNAVAKAKDIVNTFKKELSTSQYDDLMRQIQMAENAYGKTEEARAMIVKILKGVGIGSGVIWGGGKILGSMGD
jgi:hypothetical protein